MSHKKIKMEHSPKIQALIEQVRSGQMQTNKASILHFIMQHPGQNKVLIGKYLNIPHQTVTARLSDLEDMGLIEGVDAEKYSLFFYIPDSNAQRIHRAKRAAEKLEAWAKKGLQLDLPKSLKNELQILTSPEDVQSRG